MISKSILAALAIVVTATSGTAQAGETTAPKAAAKQREKLYCIKEAMVGSRIAQKTCLTKAEWARQGVDVDELRRA